MAQKLGLGVAHALPLPGVSAGNMPDAAWKEAKRGEKWTTGDSFNYGIGQGFTLASPLQLAVMTARLATGTDVAPRLVRAVGGEPAALAAPAGLGVSEANLRRVQEGMNAVTNEGGTAARSRIADPAKLMAGKTGTSQVRIITAAERAAGVTRNDQLPWNRRDHALFVAYAPYDAPRYAIAQIVEHGGGGSAVAAPIARDILLRALYGELPPLAAYPPDQRGAAEAMMNALVPLPEVDAGPSEDNA